MDLPTQQYTLNMADQMRQLQKWPEAIRLYGQLDHLRLDDGVFQHNYALCLLGAHQSEDALIHAEKALALLPALWQAAVVKVRALTSLGRAQAAAQELEALRLRYPERPEFALELSNIVLHQECDAHRARQLVRPYLSTPATSTDAKLTDLMASLYDRDESAQDLNARILEFSAAHLDRNRDAPSAPVPKRSNRCGRMRIGLLSPHFNCSPVFFFCSGALSLLFQEFDLYFFNRGKVSDWATTELRLFATDWFDVAELNALQLDAFIRKQALDVLVDLGGWMDPIGLQAISTKPAQRMFKWVGGQSVTTGLRAFDGFITDLAQTPIGFEGWYAEPLVRLPNGYVSYSPPPYMPLPVAANTQHHVLGVIANPVKVSRPFLTLLCNSLQHRSKDDTPLELRFIDKRYDHNKLQTRILTALQSAQRHLGEKLHIKFVVPDSHLSYLNAVGQLSAVADTFPYTGGLTTMEALTLGVPCSSQVGTLFCERHTHAHRSYLRKGGTTHAEPPRPLPGEARHSLVPSNSPRLNHQALAASLAQLFATGNVEEATA